MTLERFEFQGKGKEECITWVGVKGDLGIVSAWFSDVRHVIGRSVCSGAIYHSRYPVDMEDVIHGHCDLMEAEGWCYLGSSLVGLEAAKWWDEGDREFVYRWLENEYEAEFKEEPSED